MRLELTRFGAPTTLELSSNIVRLPIVLPGLLLAGSIFLICGLGFWQNGLIATMFAGAVLFLIQRLERHLPLPPRDTD